jgi:hypothetical protein
MGCTAVIPCGSLNYRLILFAAGRACEDNVANFCTATDGNRPQNQRLGFLCGGNSERCNTVSCVFLIYGGEVSSARADIEAPAQFGAVT